MRLRILKRQYLTLCISLLAIATLFTYSIILLSDNRKLHAENQQLIKQSSAIVSKTTENYLPQAQEVLNVFIGVVEHNLPFDVVSLGKQIQYCRNQSPLTRLIPGQSPLILTEGEINSIEFKKESNCEYYMIATSIDATQNNIGASTSGDYLNGILGSLRPSSY